MADDEENDGTDEETNSDENESQNLDAQDALVFSQGTACVEALFFEVATELHFHERTAIALRMANHADESRLLF